MTTKKSIKIKKKNRVNSIVYILNPIPRNSPNSLLPNAPCSNTHALNLCLINTHIPISHKFKHLPLNQINPFSSSQLLSCFMVGQLQKWSNPLTYFLRNRLFIDVITLPLILDFEFVLNFVSNLEEFIIHSWRFKKTGWGLTLVVRSSKPPPQP